MNSLNTFLARRFQSKQHLPGALRLMRAVTIVGIALGVATLIIALSITRGFERDYRKAILSFSSHVTLFKSSEENNAKQVEHLFGTMSEIKTILPFLDSEGMMVGNGEMQGIVLRGIRSSALLSSARMHIDFFAGVDSLSNSNAILIGSEIAKQFKITQGQTVDFLFPKNNASKDNSYNRKSLYVVGTFKSGLFDYDSQFALMNIENIGRFLGKQQPQLTGYELELYQPELVDPLVKSLRNELQYSYAVMGWKELNQELFAAVKLEKVVLSLVMGVVIFVAALNIISLLVLSVLYRRYAISVLHALGLTRRRMRFFLVRTGLFTAAFGVLLGEIIGVLVAIMLTYIPLIPLEAEVYFLSRLPLDISPLICGIIGVFCLGLCWICSQIAAWQIVKMPLMEGLQQAH